MIDPDPGAPGPVPVPVVGDGHSIILHTHLTVWTIYHVLKIKKLMNLQKLKAILI